MKRNYIQPIVETAEVLATSLMQAGSNGISVSETPIEDNGGGD